MANKNQSKDDYLRDNNEVLQEVLFFKKFGLPIKQSTNDQEQIQEETDEKEK